jgi:hypothetical protein
MRGPCRFKKTEVTRAAKAVRAAGLEIARVEVDRDGLIRVVPGKPGEACNPTEPKVWDQLCHASSIGASNPADDLDRELAEFSARHDQD